jgi:hypothetical protein
MFSSALFWILVGHVSLFGLCSFLICATKPELWLRSSVTSIIVLFFTLEIQIIIGILYGLYVYNRRKREN